MSLINEMLKELDERGHKDPLAARMQQHVRPVRRSAGLHPAWWIALALLALLIGVSTWAWRQSQSSRIPADLALRIAPQIFEVQNPPAAVSQLPASPPTAAVSTASTVETGNAAPVAVDALATVAKSEQASEPKISQPAPVSLTLQVSPLAKAAAQEHERPTTANATASTVTTSAVPAQDKPGTFSKEVKEFTPSQKAENEYRLATAAAQQGNVTEAMARLDQALSFDARHGAARQMLVALLIDQKRNDEALKQAQLGLAQDPAQLGLAMILARIQVERGDAHGASETLRKTLPYAGERGDFHAFYAAALQREKRHAEAVDQFKAALTLAPNTGVWWMGLAISYEALGQSQNASDAYTRARDTGSLKADLLAFVEQKLEQLRR